MDKSQSWEVVDTEVLIVGGGFGGLWAALRAAELGTSVTLVDKSFAGKSGHSFLAGGAMVVLLPGDDPDQYLYDITLGNEWLVDQEMVTAVLDGSYARLKDLESFGIPFRKRGEEYVWTRARGAQHIKNLWPQNASAADEVLVLRKVALARGVKIINHLYVYDLLKESEGRVCGVAGIGVKDQKNYLITAKSVILATNTGSYRGHHLACELQGTGPFMAFEAGAQIKNPEFHYINIRPAKHEIEGSGILPAIGARWKNAKNQHFMKNYDPLLEDRAPVFKIVISAAKEALKGNAPICIDVEGMTEEEREKFRILQVSHGWMPLLFRKCESEEGYDPLRDNIEWQPAYECNKLGIRADVDCRTSLKGLFAAGMARTLGVNPFTGWSITSCTWSGYRAGESAAMAAKSVSLKQLDFKSLIEAKKRFFQPFAVGKGHDPDRLVHELQKILFPADVLIIMSEPKLQEALDRVIRLKEERLPSLQASDVRGLIKARETQTMCISAEMTLRAALMRQETRESIFYREDYPRPDNAKWLKWIFVEKAAPGEMLFTTEAVPIERYRFQPEGPE
ncbi:MAG: FAD-binding protein [Syntrophales bacterium]|jgi:succinate dehydrogenase/fumarate reductase flavoprotein subunit|nr:FAD-binding protein [Syntrophales bacterium]